MQEGSSVSALLWPRALLMMAFAAVTSIASSAPQPPTPFPPSSSAFHDAHDPFLSPAEVAAFSNTTANGVRREGLDTALRKYAFMALSHARTGTLYNVPLPPILDGIFCHAMRVRAGSAHKRGLTFNEFTIPQGLTVQTGGPFVTMVYRRIFNFTLYTPPPGYGFASSVVGIVIYTNLNTTFDASLPEMSVVSPKTSITAKLTISEQITRNNNNYFVPFRCAFYDINGTASITNVSSYPDICSSKTLMDVALIVPSSATTTAASSPSLSPTRISTSSSPSKHASSVWKIALVSALGGVVSLTLLAAIIIMGFKVRDECQMAKVEEPPDDEVETLQTSLIGHTRAPTAAGVRTRPILETGSLHLHT